jgi:5'-deoxynucleotidase YfbR-like HD superfamily hydrolase
METNRGNWFCTVSGKKHYVLEPSFWDLAIDDIATGLAHACRFGGQIRSFYSVAQHSVLVSDNVPFEFAFEGLMHDASEAYLGDVIRPLKLELHEYQRIEEIWMAAISHRFKLNFDKCERVVKDADRRALMTERRDIAIAWRLHRDWSEDELGYEPFEDVIVPMQPDKAYAAFMRQYELLNRGTFP